MWPKMFNKVYILLDITKLIIVLFLKFKLV